MRRIAFAGFLHESNSFAPAPADIDCFDSGGGYMPTMRGAEIRPATKGVNTGMAGAYDFAESVGWEVIPILWTGAMPSAPVTRAAYELFVGEILAGLSAAGPLDGIYLDLHGAMMADHHPDGEGELLSRIRKILPDVPISVSLDLHGNITQRMFDLAQVLVGYRTYPHIDMAETGHRAATALEQYMNAEKPWAKARRTADFLIAVSWQCTDMEPCRSLYQMTRDLPEGVASASLFMGFPASDFEECGPSLYVYGPDPVAVKAHADAMLAALNGAETSFNGEAFDPEEAVRRAMEIAKTASRPVVIADTQDNPGAGGSSDTTGMLRALVACGAKDAAIGLLHDPEAARLAHAAGEGATITLALGGKSGMAGDEPYEVTAVVERLSDGRVHVTGPFYGGKVLQMGLSAALRIDDVRVVVTSHISQMADRCFYRMVGIVPEEQKILVNKSSVHFRADFEPIAETILVATAPGAMPLCPSSLPWTRLRDGLKLHPMGPRFSARG